MFIHEANDDFMDRHGLQDPVERLQQVHRNRIEKVIPEFERLQVTEEVQQWRRLLSAQFAEACGGHQLGALDVRVGPTAHLSSEQNVKAKLVPVDLVVEQFLCDKCGFAFASQSALRSHQFKMHFEEGEKEQRHQEIRKQQRRDVCEHAKGGMPTCIHCQHQFDFWPAFTYHVNSRSCPEIRKFFGGPELRNALAELPKALVARVSILAAAVDTSWQLLAMLPEVQNSHHHCLECHHWSAKPQYVRRHMLAKHKDLVSVVRNVESFIQEQDFGLISPCKYCGLVFKQRRAHLKSCVGIFNGVYLYKRLARASGTHGGSSASHSGAGFDCRLTAAGCSRKPSSNPSLDPYVNRCTFQERQGNGAGGRPTAQVAQGGKQGRVSRAKAKGQRQPTITKFFQVGRLEQRQRLDQQEEGRADRPPSESGQHADNTAAAPREPIGDKPPGHNVYVVCSDRHDPELGQQHVSNWTNLEENETGIPGNAEAPMRVILFQHLIGTVAARLEALTSQPESLVKAQEMGWLTSNMDCLTAVKWDPESKKHVLDPDLPEVPICQAKDMLIQSTKLCVTPLVINRFHATRPLAENYTNPTLAMMLEIGLRTEEANMVWRNLNMLSQCSLWVAAGTYLRRERMQRSALANRLASVSG